MITGAGRAFSAGGDFTYLGMLRDDPELRAESIADGREVVLGMVRRRIPVVAAVSGPAVGLANHVVADPSAEASTCAQRLASQPRQAIETTKRLLNLHLERAVVATLDFATTAEEASFQTEDFLAIVARLTAEKG